MAGVAATRRSMFYVFSIPLLAPLAFADTLESPEFQMRMTMALPQDDGPAADRVVELLPTIPNLTYTTLHL